LANTDRKTYRAESAQAKNQQASGSYQSSGRP
jgi:hypothetical protein